MAKIPSRRKPPTPNGNQAIRDQNQKLYNRMLVRRAALREILETNYGAYVSMTDIAHMLDDRGHASGPSTLREDFREMNVELVSATVNGKAVKFYALCAHAADRTPEDLRHTVPPEIIENEAYKEMLQCVSDVFVDGKAVVIITAYERAKHLALWIRNLGWPEIWYLSKEDGSTLIIQTATEKRAQFLRERIWGFMETDSLTGWDLPIHQKKEE